MAFKWTNSALSVLETCGEKFRRKYIEREYAPPSPRQLRGTVVHGSIRMTMKRKQAEGALPTVEEVVDVAATDFQKAWLGGVQASRADLEEYGTLGAIHDDTQNAVIDLSRLHVQAVAPGITPVGVEQRVTVPDSQLGVELEGTLDLVDAQADGDWVLDAKTGVRSPNADAAHTSQQFTMYGLLELVRVGHLPAGYRQDHLIRTPKKKEVKHVPLTTTRDMEDIHTMVRRIRAATAAVEKGVFIPTTPDAWACSETWCEWWATCPYVNAGRTRPTN